MNSDTGFSCHQLDKDDVYQIDNSKSSCALFVIQGRVNFDLGKSYEGEMEQRQMLYIPQNMKAQIESITGSRCILLFWDKHISTCDKLFLSSLSIKENDTDTNDVILPIKKPLMNVLESVNLYLNARLLCRHMHLLKQQELLLVLRGFYTKKELAAFFSASTNIRESFERFVLDNYRKADSVKELADLYHISERSFNRKFHSCFGESPYKSPTDMGVNMAGNCIVDDEVCKEAARQEIIRRYYKSMEALVRGTGREEEVYKIELLLKQAHVTIEERKVVPAALKREEETGAPAAALELPDGRIVTGKTSELLGASSALLLNALKELAGIDHDKHVISPEALRPIQALKTEYLGSKNPRLHSDETLIALSISAADNEDAKLALQQIPKLKGCQVHTSVLLSQVDILEFRKLGVELTCEPKSEHAKKLQK